MFSLIDYALRDGFSTTIAMEERENILCCLATYI